MLLKLKKEAAEEGVFLVRWSALDYRRIILAVLNKNEVSQHPHSSLGVIAVQWCNFFSCWVYTCVSLCRMAQQRATSSFVSCTRIQSSVWRAGTENSPVWRSSQITLRPLCSSLAMIVTLSKSAVCQDREVCVYRFMASSTSALSLYCGISRCFVCAGLCDAEISNLLVKRQGVDRRMHTDSLFLNLTQLRFHQIKDKEIKQVMIPTILLYIYIHFLICN